MLIFPILRERLSEKGDIYRSHPAAFISLSAHLKFPLFTTKSQAKPFHNDCLTLTGPSSSAHTHTHTHTSEDHVEDYY